MIDVKEAVQAARAYAQEVFGGNYSTVEEIERDEYKGHEVWRITLGFREPVGPYFVAATGQLPKEYKSFFIDVETGETLAMRIRELAA